MSLVLAGGLIASGCVQDERNYARQPSGGQNPDNTTGAGSQNHLRGPGFLSNATQISEAATKLGVTENVLQEALNSSTGGRPNLTAAAQLLGVTQQELSDALGIPAGGFRGRFGDNTTTISNP